MRTKFSLALGPRQPLSPQTAWGCLTSNLALPGIGSLMAGRVVGYAQAALAFGGFGLTMIFGVRFIIWYIAHWSQLNGTDTDRIEMLGGLWLAVRWALLGIGLFVLGWLWALSSSLQIVREAKQTEPPTSNEPPKLM